MPQASDEDRARAIELFGTIMDEGVSHWLKARGYREAGEPYRWHWIKPTPEHAPTEEELFAVGFLIDEWDYGGGGYVPEDKDNGN